MSSNSNNRHELVEKNVGLLAILIVIAISFGSLVEITPLLFQKDTTEPLEGQIPYTALQIEGRDIYVREGYIAEVELQNMAYTEKVEALQLTLSKLEKEERILREGIEEKNDTIANLKEELGRIPKDEEFKDYTVLDANASWDEILRAIEMADDTSSID